MLNVNPSVVSLSVIGCVLYVLSMSALGRRLASCREDCSMAYIAPAANVPLKGFIAR
jgi:hypothetical protein